MSEQMPKLAMSEAPKDGSWFLVTRMDGSTFSVRRGETFMEATCCLSRVALPTCRSWSPQPKDPSNE